MMSGSWVRKRAINNQLVEPCCEKRVHEDDFSFSLSCRDRDLDISDEFQTFTNANSSRMDSVASEVPPGASLQADRVTASYGRVALARSIEYFHIPRNLLSICVGKATDARYGIGCERDAIRAGVGGIRESRNL